MDAFRSMRVFTRVIELRSFSAAARDLNIGQPTVSKMIASLETDLGVKLLNRTTSRLTPTDEGMRFYTRSKVILEEYGEAVEEAREHTCSVAGLLRVNVPVGLGELRLNALFMDFLETYPEVQIEVLFNDRIVDLVEEGVDVALRLGDSLPPDAVARKIAVSPRVLVASPSYLGRTSCIREPGDLAEKSYIKFLGAGYGDTIELTNEDRHVAVRTNGRYKVGNSLALRESLLRGLGFGSAPAWLVQDLVDDGSLNRLLAGWDMHHQAIHVIYSSRRYLPARTRALVQFLTERIRKLPGCSA
ncbi:LysR family transcriptional regulator [Stappia sp.]|uniref:LysR family transcriptional regulator n=1 Tax=Stappia sp. TaxID=1870903 RepID=UPI003D13A7C1